MAKVRTNQLLEGLKGMIGNLVFRSMPDGTTWVSGAPDFSGRTFSKRQKDHQERFRRAAAHARWAAKEKPIYSGLAKGTGLTAYNVALSDWLRPPVIHCIEKRDGRILVEASDNVLVTKVVITILDEQGQVVEKGEAVRGNGDRWEYMPRLEGKTILAEAWDLPGHVSESRRAE